MSEQRLIDANALVKDMETVCSPTQFGRNTAKMCIKRAPTIHAEVVVHCENCKHIRILNISEIYAICDKTNFIFQPFGVDTREFGCPYGERRESEVEK